MTNLLPERQSTGTPGRWEPLSDLDQAAERIRRTLEQTFGGLGGRQLSGDSGPWLPAVEIEEADDAYVVEAELPGVDRKDIDIELVGNELLITGELKERERKGIIRRRTRRVGRFEARIILPDRVDPDKVEASLDRGVLTVRIPKSETAQRRRIEVKS
jgi:HSP20 family protein